MAVRRRLAIVMAAVVLATTGGVLVLVSTGPTATGLVPFRGYSDLSSFLTASRANTVDTWFGGAFRSNPAVAAPAAPQTGTPSAPAYSGTNVQVSGVDELDMVKTDGRYLYIASQGAVNVLLAYPATEMRSIAHLNLTDPLDQGATPQATGLFLNGTRLVVVADSYAAGGWGSVAVPATGVANPVLAGGTPWVSVAQTYVFLYNVSDPSSPHLDHSVVVSGNPSTGRMVGPTVYLVSTQWIEQINGTYALPQVCVDGSCRAIDANTIYHDPESTDAWDYTNLLAVDMATGAAKPMSIVTGGYSTLYMSPTALYLAFFKWTTVRGGPGIAIPMMQVGDSWTTIYKITADGLDLAAVASANVPGSLRDQYSLDEWNGYLRVATTVRSFSENESSVRNDVYVFDGLLNLVGSLQGIAPGETIFAVRFLGDRAYVVTFRKIDPLFVIDLSNPSAPQVSGYLKVPGFSEYLYPINGSHLLGVGKDAIPAIEGNWSWYQGLKLSLFNVTVPSAPSEIANVTIGDRGTDSEVLWDPHAFLFVPSRDLVVLPVDLAIIDPSQYPGGVPSSAWGNVVWQGVYVYHVDASSGLSYVGRLANGNGTVNQTYGWYDSPNQIRRSLYIGDTLYTVSATEVLASSLEDLSPIREIVYAAAPACAYCGIVPMVAP